MQKLQTICSGYPVKCGIVEVDLSYAIDSVGKIVQCQLAMGCESYRMCHVCSVCHAAFISNLDRKYQF